MDDIDKLRNTLGAALRKARLEAGLTEKEMAARAGLVPTLYGRLEGGRVMPSVPLLHRLCSLLHLSVNAMLGMAPAGQTPTPPPSPPQPPEVSEHPPGSEAPEAAEPVEAPEPAEAPEAAEPAEDSPELIALARQLCSLSAAQRRSLMAIARFLARHPPDPDDEPPQQ